MQKARKERSRLLRPDALSGVCLGISVSESPDLARLGLAEAHFRLAIAEIARCVLISGGHLAYGGRLKPEGYTEYLVHELERYSRRDRSLRIFLAWPEHRSLSLTAIEAERINLALYGEILCLDPAGKVIAAGTERGEAPLDETDINIVRSSLTSLRQHMTGVTQARVLIGGRRSGFQGEMPGVLEEAIYAVAAGQPLYLAGGFGGVTHDIACTLGADDGKWLPTLSPPETTDEKLVLGLQRLREVVRKTGVKSLENGLSSAENHQLAVCYRPSEIATLVSLGLGRRFSNTERPG